MVRWIALALSIAARPALATYSIAAVDTTARQVGGAGTSCVGRFSVSNIYGSVPGVGVVHAQAQLNTAARDRAVELLAMGEDPAAIIADITSSAFDPEADLRQYGVVHLRGAAEAFTGARTGTWAGHRTGTFESFVFTVQGNILTSETVVANAEEAFTGGGCDLADRLMLALEAGATGGEGDSRCTPRGIPSDSGFIRVDLEGEPGWLDIEVVDTAPEDPLRLLRRDYDAWRATHPCPEPRPPPDAGTALPDAAPDASMDAGPPPARDAGSEAPPPMGKDTDASSCGCRAMNGPGDAPAGLLLALLLYRRRRVFFSS
jgi:uncharacterized Ntn-hydrolase superfamily protein